MQIESVGYGSPALHTLRQIVGELKAEDPMESVTIVVPNNIAGIVARRHLAKGWGASRNGVAALDLTTLRRLAERFATPEMAPRRPLTMPVRAAAWRTALAHHHGLLSAIADHPATVDALMAADDELRMVDEQALRAIAATNNLTEELVRLHRRVRDAAQSDWYDETDLLRAAADADLAALGSVVLYLPQVLTPPERDLVAALDRAAEVRVLLGLTGLERADAAVRRWLPEAAAGSLTRPDPANGTAAMNASDSDEEVRWMVRQVVEALRQHRPERIVVLYSRTDPYARLLHEQLAGAGITINGPGVRSVRERSVARFVLELLALPDSDFARVDVFRALSGVAVLDREGRRIPVSQWERIARTAGVVRGTDWTARLDWYRRTEETVLANEQVADDRNEGFIERTQATIAAIADLQVFVGHLREQLDRGAALRDWAALTAWAMVFVEQSLQGVTESRLPAEEAYALATVRTALAGLAGLERVEASATLTDLGQTLDQVLSRASPRVGRFGEGVYVGPVASSIGLDADVVFVLGLSEDAYPGRLHESALLPDRARVAAGDQIRQPRDELDRRQRVLQVALRAAPHAVVSFPRGDLRRSTERLPSRFVLPTLRALSGDHHLAATDWASADCGSTMSSVHSHSGELITTRSLATEQEWRTRRTAADTTSSDPIVTAAQRMIDARASAELTAYDGLVGPLEGLPDYATGSPSISPTALESYASCPFAFFARRLLRVEPLEQPEDVVSISPADIGSLIHAVMDDLVQGVKEEQQLPSHGEPWSHLHRQRLIQHLRARERDYLEQGLTGHPRLWQGEQRRIEADLLAMIDDDDRWRHTYRAAIVDSELTFGLKGLPGIELPVARGTISLRGSADKLDERSDGALVVTDIKTGGFSRFTAIEGDDPFVHGTKLQLPVYALAARARHGTASTPVSACYWFVRKGHRRISVELSAELVDRFSSVVSTLTDAITAGLFPAKAPESVDWSWVQCPYCNPDGMGHGGLRDAWERKRTDPLLAHLVALIDPLEATR